MEKFFNDVLSPYWWISVVVIGVILNIAATYLKDFIDKKRARWSESYSEKLKKKRLEEEQQIEALATDETLRTMYLVNEFREAISAMFLFLLLAILMIIEITMIATNKFVEDIISLAFTVVFLLALAVTMIIAFKKYKTWLKKHYILDSAMEKVVENQEQKRKMQQPLTEKSETME